MSELSARERGAVLIPDQKDFYFVPLGGCGEIGMNLNLFGHAGKWLMVDCGITFEKNEANIGAGNRVEMPDPIFISNRSEALVGIIATHAHEDHIGAIAHLWPQLGCPIYTTPFTRQVLLRKLRQKGIDAPIVTVQEGETIDLGPFTVTWMPITHSTPETNALLIETVRGRVLHTADWKIDSAPIVGRAFESDSFKAIGKGGIDAIVCDSTNATIDGHSFSESELFQGLLNAVSQSRGRVIVGCFSSNVARLQTLGHVAQVTGRYVGIVGRSIEAMVQNAKAAGYLKENFNHVDSFNLGYLLPNEILAIATGSQGEPRAALHRLASDTHPEITLAAGDHVIFSAKTIPGNELDVERLVSAFKDKGVQVTQADDADKPIHASGHPYSEELALMYDWVKPRIAIPVHGEDKHMQSNAKIAKDRGVPIALTGRNGDIFDLVSGKVLTQKVPAGRLWLDDSKRESRLRPVD
ncbi:MAG: ribonuclease J [Pseudohongiellaceae bacterium]